MESAYYSPDTLNQIPVSNLASFMLEEVEKNQFLKKAVAVDLPKQFIVSKENIIIMKLFDMLVKLYLALFIFSILTIFKVH